MDLIAEIQRRHLVSKESISSIAREWKLSRPTVRNLARQLVQTDAVIIDELGYLPFPASGGALLFHLISQL